MPEMRGIKFDGQNVSPQEKYELAKDDYDDMKKYFRNYPELKELKNEIEWDVFWKIVEEVSVKSGIDPQQLNKLDKYSIMGISDFLVLEKDQNDIMGIYLENLNAVLIDYDLVKKYSKEYNVNEKMVAMDTIFHELVHSFSNVQISTKQMPHKRDAIATSTDIGYFSNQNTITLNRDKAVFKNKAMKFWLVNEAVTQGMAEEIFDQYVQRTGSYTKKDIEDYRKNYYESKSNVYKIFVDNLKKICEVVGEKAGVQGDIVWKGFVRGIFYNKTLEDTSVKKWFADAFSPSFLPELAAVKDEQQFRQLMEKYKLG